MGAGTVDVGAVTCAASAHSELQLKTEYFGAAALCLVAPAETGVRVSWSAADVWRKIGLQLSWLHAIAAGSVLILALGFAEPAAAHAPALRAAGETVITFFAATTSWIFRAQFARTRRSRDLLLFGALLMLALIEFFTYSLPAVLQVQSGGYFAAVLLWGQLGVAAAFAAAALAPSSRFITGIRRPVAVTVSVTLAAVILAGLLGLFLRGEMLHPATHAVFGVREALRDPLAVVIVLWTAGLFGYGALGFARTARIGRDGAMSLLAGACILEAAERLYYFPLPWLSPDWIAPREGLRLLAFGLVFAAGVRRELRTRAGIAIAATIAERRRVARDLHDGLAQDLALIAAHSSRIATELGREHPVTVAARRALAVSRGTISDLSDPAGATTQEALEGLAHELRDRFEIEIAVAGDLDFEPAPYAREQMTRIAREAIANAARHGGARNVHVSLTRTDEGVALCVRDDGCGIGVTGGTPAQEGFGLRSMRERAAAMGGYLVVRQPGKLGTELEVVIP